MSSLLLPLRSPWLALPLVQSSAAQSVFCARRLPRTRACLCC
ncbi:hypothetical protein I309_05254 [Cryptococcus deuterogattii LA55]|nr:hypothetical protein I309_05254 [Cryptococcus deuterogattii LA55]KIR91835.1 hypothetical protein I304_03995 [Cryptococcus deuterogattii CBS 10090]